MVSDHLEKGHRDFACRRDPLRPLEKIAGNARQNLPFGEASLEFLERENSNAISGASLFFDRCKIVLKLYVVLIRVTTRTRIKVFEPGPMLFHFDSCEHFLLRE